TVGGTAVAEATSHQPDVAVFRHRELGPRATDEVPVDIDVLRERHRLAHTPSVSRELAAVLALAPSQREVEARACSSRHVQELRKLQVLAPAVCLAAEADLAPLLPPVADRGVAIAWRDPGVSPEIDHHRLARGQ